MRKKPSFLYSNSLSIVLAFIFLILLAAQAFTGWKEHNHSLEESDVAAITFSDYITTGHFVETTFENWESEFLQMAAYVLLTIGLRQRGSSESKSITKVRSCGSQSGPQPEGSTVAREEGRINSDIVQKFSLDLPGDAFCCKLYPACVGKSAKLQRGTNTAGARPCNIDRISSYVPVVVRVLPKLAERICRSLVAGSAVDIPTPEGITSIQTCRCARL